MIAVLWRDLRLATRAGGGFGLGLVFFLIVVVLVPFGVGPQTAVLSQIASGILWVAALLAALLSLDRIFALDHEDGALARRGQGGGALADHRPAAKYCCTSAGRIVTTSAKRLCFCRGHIVFGHARLVDDRHFWRGIDGWYQARRFVVVIACFAALCADTDFWRRGGAAWRAGSGCGDAIADACGDYGWFICFAALCDCGSIAHQFALNWD